MRLLILLTCLVMPSLVLAQAPAVENPATPSNGKFTVELQELWRLGGESEDDEEFFGVIADVQEIGGEVYLLDSQLTEVRVFTQDGEYLRTIGREGEGPGEFRQPTNILDLPGGNIGVVQRRPGRIVMLTPDGEPAGLFPLGDEFEGFSFLQAAYAAGGTVGLLSNHMRRDDTTFSRTSRLTAVTDGGSNELRSTESSVEMGGSITIVEKETLPLPWTVGADGRVLTCIDDTYQFEVYGADGTLAHKVTREFEPYLRSDDEKDKVKERLSGRMRFRRGGGNAPDLDIVVSENEPAVQWMAGASDGLIWVLNAREAKSVGAGEIATYDIFDADGHFIRELTLLGQGNIEDDRIILGKDRLYVVTQFYSALAAWMGRGGDEEEEEEDYEDFIPMEVICYSLEGIWNPPTGAGR